MTTLTESHESQWSIRFTRYAYITILLSSTLGIVFGVIGGILHDTYIVYRKVDTDGTLLRAYGSLTVPYILYGLAIALSLLELISLVILRSTTSRAESWLQTHHEFYTRLIIYSFVFKIIVYVGMGLILIITIDFFSREGISAIIGTWGLVSGVASASWMASRVISSRQSFKNRDSVRR